MDPGFRKQSKSGRHGTARPRHEQAKAERCAGHDAAVLFIPDAVGDDVHTKPTPGISLTGPRIPRKKTRPRRRTVSPRAGRTTCAPRGARHCDNYAREKPARHLVTPSTQRLALGAYSAKGGASVCQRTRTARAVEGLSIGPWDVAGGGRWRVMQTYDSRADCDLVCFDEALTRRPLLYDRPLRAS